MKKLTFFLWLSFFVPGVFAQQNPITDTTLKALIQQAVTNFPRIKELEEQLRVSDVKEELLHSNYQPTLYWRLPRPFLSRGTRSSSSHTIIILPG
jgi:outer membrane protein